METDGHEMNTEMNIGVVITKAYKEIMDKQFKRSILDATHLFEADIEAYRWILNADRQDIEITEIKINEDGKEKGDTHTG